MDVTPLFIQCKIHGTVTKFICAGKIGKKFRYRCRECYYVYRRKYRNNKKTIELLIKENNSMSFTAKIEHTNAELDNHDVFFYNANSEKQIGYAYLSKKEKKVGLVRCPSCHKENFPTAILKGKCAWCKFDAIAFVAQIKTNPTESNDKKPKENKYNFEKVEKKMNSSKIKPAKPFIGLSTIKPEFEWDEITHNRVGRYATKYQDRITVRKFVNKLSTADFSYKITITIGREIGQLLGVHKGDMINLYRDKRNTNLFMLKKAEHAGYVLTQAKGSQSLSSSPTVVEDVKSLSHKKSYFAKFDIYGDNSVIIDMSQVEQI
jgi:hypothetical protein